MKLYRFSPILNVEQLIEAVKYTVTQTSKLCEKLVGKTLPIGYLTIFSHYPDEYENLVKILQTLGKPHDENNGPRFELHEPIEVGEHKIKYLRIRKPDPYRMQVGCNDFEVENYQEFKDKYLTKQSQNLRLIVREEYQMIEFFDPDFDVLAYVVS